jgi:hypothetical protein
MAANSLGIPALPRKVNDPAGTNTRRVVVQGTGAREVKNPAAANEGRISGVVEHVDHRDGANGSGVSVRTLGEAECLAASAIAVGDPVNIADAAGRVKAVGGEAAGTVINLVGDAVTAATAAGDIVTVDLQRRNHRFTV